MKSATIKQRYLMNIFFVVFFCVFYCLIWCVNDVTTVIWRALACVVFHVLAHNFVELSWYPPLKIILKQKILFASGSVNIGEYIFWLRLGKYSPIFTSLLSQYSHHYLLLNHINDKWHHQRQCQLIILLHLAEYRLILANSDYGLVAKYQEIFRTISQDNC